MTAELRSIYSGPIRRALERFDRGLDTVKTKPTAGNALGIVAMGTLSSPNPVVGANTWGNVAGGLNAFLSVGRRYQIVLAVRAVSTATPGGYQNRLSINTGTQYPEVQRWHWSPGVNQQNGYSGFYNEWIMDGDGTAHSFTSQVNCPGQTITVYSADLPSSGMFYLEDIGPNSSPALPLPETYPTFTPVTFAGTWANFDTGSPLTWSQAAYRKIGDIVEVRGVVKNASSVGPGTVTIFTLPVGFRPPAGVMFATYGMQVGGSGSGLRLDVSSAGLVNYIAPSAAAVDFFSLSPIRFSTTA